MKSLQEQRFREPCAGIRIAILSRAKSIYSTRRLTESAMDRGYEAHVIDYRRCHIGLSNNVHSAHLGDANLAGFDVVIPRIGASHTFLGAALVRQFELMGTLAANKAQSISRTRDKLACLQLLARKGIRLPQTLAAHSPAPSELLKQSGMFPKIVQAIDGPGSPSRVRVASRSAAKSVIEGFRELGAGILLQEILDDPGSAGIRCLVVGRKVVAAVRHGSQIGPLRWGVGRGASPIEILPEERALAVRAARVLGLGVAGIDLLRSRRGPFLLDVHCSPELRRVEAATGMDLAGRIVDFVVNATKS